VIGGGFLYPYAYPYAYPYTYSAYAYPPSYGYGWYPPPPPDDEYDEYEEEAPPPSSGEASVPPGAPGDDALAAPDDGQSQGMIRLLDVPDGAALSLDGRHWLEAHDLAGQWFSLPAGTHTIGIRASGHLPAERRVDVRAGGQQVVRVGPLA
jgi:hypothetical protein